MPRSDFLSTFVGGTVLLIIGFAVITNVWIAFPFIILIIWFCVLAIKMQREKPIINKPGNATGLSELSQAEQVQLRVGE